MTATPTDLKLLALLALLGLAAAALPITPASTDLQREGTRPMISSRALLQQNGRTTRAPITARTASRTTVPTASTSRAPTRVPTRAPVLPASNGTRAPFMPSTRAPASSLAVPYGMTAEIKLVAVLDEPRGWCVDMSGSKTSASTTSPLQGHTCYDYEGAIAVDQGVAMSEVASGALRFPFFGVCVVGTGIAAGSPVTLTSCGSGNTAAIRMSSAGLISPVSASQLCLTIGATSTPGGGGNPVHRKRGLTWATCSEADAARQTWSLYAL